MGFHPLLKVHRQKLVSFVIMGFHPLLKVHRQKLVSFVIMGFHPLLKVHHSKFASLFMALFSMPKHAHYWQSNRRASRSSQHNQEQR
jgi:hypothetical protein